MLWKNINCILNTWLMWAALLKNFLVKICCQGTVLDITLKLFQKNEITPHLLNNQNNTSEMYTHLFAICF